MTRAQREHAQEQAITRLVGPRVVDGVVFHHSTPDELIRTLLNLYQYSKDMRVRIYYGDRTTGRAWGDSYTGYLGASTGPQKILLICHNRRSMGGEALLDDCIIKIEYANKQRASRFMVGVGVWQHPKFHVSRNRTNNKAAEVSNVNQPAQNK